MRTVKGLGLWLMACSVAGFSLASPLLAAEVVHHVPGMIGQTVVNTPVVAQAPAGTTVVFGNTFLNTSSIFGFGRESASMVTIRPPAMKGRIIYRSNRVFNMGSIIHKGGDGAAGMVTLETKPGQTAIEEVINNRSLNAGRIMGLK